MYDRILIPLDGSRFGEEIVPYAVGLARPVGARVTLLRAVQRQEGLATAEEYVSDLASRLGAEGKVAGPPADPATTIVRELEQEPGTLVAMTTHGRTGLLETALGSVVRSVVQDAPRPVLLHRPRGGDRAPDIDREVAIATVVAPLDGSAFSERMLPHAVGIAQAVKAALTLVQVLPPAFDRPPLAPAGDVLESTYVRRWARRIREEHGIEVEWDVLHGEPADAICRYLEDRSDALLAMSSHARPRLKETVLGSVTRECVRRSGVPVLVWGARA